MRTIPGLEITDQKALREWVESPEHLNGCIAFSEGGFCCLEELVEYDED